MTDSASGTKVAVVTGASRGLERNTLQNLAKRRVRSVFTYRANKGAADEVVADLEMSGGGGL